MSDHAVAGYEAFHSYRNGWRDAAFSKMKDPKFVKHTSRPDLVEAYERGYAEGRIAYDTAMGREMKRVGYKPNVLRGPPPSSPPPFTRS